MSAEPDFYRPAKGASVTSAGTTGTFTGEPANPATDEAALMNILRLLNRVRPDEPLTPVQRAFLLGARAMFEELKQICDQFLKRQPAPTAAPAITAASEVAQEPEPTTRSRPRRLTPGGSES